jgi:DedD protein
VEITVKQRLAGAIVLIALGVIFIPMLLDGAGMMEKDRLEMRLPPKPRYDFPRHIEVEPLPEPVKEEVVSTKEEKISEEPKPVKKPEPEKPKPEKPRASAKPSKSLSTSTSTKTTSKSPALTTYVIQVGSFGERKNALALRDKLRKAGFTAYVETTKASGKEMTRVKVGPVLKRKEAESLLQRLSKEMKLKGQVVKE